MTAVLASSAVADGVTCVNCGYDLRGLAVERKCPECGQEIAQSVRWHELLQRRAPTLAASDRRWVRELHEGLLLVAVAFALAVVLAFAPAWAYEWKSPQRRWMLGVACTAWVVSCWAAWKLSRREPVNATRQPTDQRSRGALRVGAVAGIAGPFLWGMAPRYNAGWEWIVPMLACGLLGLIAAGAWFVYAGHLADRAGSSEMPIEARLLAFFNVALIIFATVTPDFHPRENSLSNLFGLHMIQLGPIETIFQLRVMVDNHHYWLHPLHCVALALPLWSVIFSVRLFALIRRAKPGGRSAASCRS